MKGVDNMSALKEKEKAAGEPRQIIAPDGSYSLKKGEIIDNVPEKNDKKTGFFKAVGSMFRKQWENCSLARKIIVILSAALFAFSFSPLVVFVWCIGTIPPALISLFCGAVALFWDKFAYSKKKWVNILCIVVAVCVSIGCMGMAFISGKMLAAGANTAPEHLTRVTVVVLGCKIYEDRPSRMLKDRLDTAAEYLLSNPEAFCVVSGGQGADEDYPEAVVMRDYLIDAGISERRILMETESTSTKENLEFSYRVIRENACWEDIIIVSDRFHQYRAGCIAEELGINSYALSCPTRFYLAMQYWFREIAVIVKMYIEGV